MREIRRILVRAPNWVGDQVMAAPFYRALRLAYPLARVGILASPSVAEISADADPLHIFKKETWYLALREVRSQKYDLAITLPSSLSSAVFLWQSGIPVRVGFGEPLSKLFLTDTVLWKGRGAGKHKADLYLDLLEWLTGHPTEREICDNRIERRTGEILIAPGASISLREWPYFEELILALRARLPDRPIRVVGASREVPWQSRLRRLSLSGVTDGIGTTTLPDLIAQMGRAALVIANDSGPAHLAATVAGCPTLVLFGPGDPAYVAPRGPAHVLRAPLPCSPCESARCAAPYGYQQCLRLLSVEAVVTAACQIL